jgi:putative membrane protein
LKTEDFDMSFIVRILVNAVALWVAVLVVPGLDHTGSIWSLLAVALIFGLVNALVRPIVLLLTCPLVVLTLGLFVIVVNALMLSLTIWLSGLFNLGFTSDGFFWATILGALVISVVSWFANLFIKDPGERESSR